MANKLKWQVYCTTEEEFFFTDYLPSGTAPNFCPNSGAHSINTALSAVAGELPPGLDGMVLKRSTGDVLVSSAGEVLFKGVDPNG